MSREPQAELSRRERQVMEIVHRQGRVLAADVQRLLPDSPSYSAVRAMLRVLEEKGHLRHEMDKNRYVYSPTVPLDQAQQTALKKLLETFFDGSAEKVVAALLKVSRPKMSDSDLDRLARLIETARKEGR